MIYIYFGHLTPGQYEKLAMTYLLEKAANSDKPALRKLKNSLKNARKNRRGIEAAVAFSILIVFVMASIFEFQDRDALILTFTIAFQNFLPPRARLGKRVQVAATVFGITCAAGFAICKMW